MNRREFVKTVATTGAAGALAGAVAADVKPARCEADDEMAAEFQSEKAHSHALEPVYFALLDACDACADFQELHFCPVEDSYCPEHDVASCRTMLEWMADRFEAVLLPSAARDAREKLTEQREIIRRRKAKQAQVEAIRNGILEEKPA